MNTFATATAFTLLAVTTTACASQTQDRPSSQNLSAPNASYSSYQRLDSAVSSPDGAVSTESGASMCQSKRHPTTDTSVSTTFAATAAQDGSVEVALAGLALRKSDDYQLRQFAQKVVENYARSNEGLDSIVKCEGLILPTGLDAKHNALIRSLNAKSGKAFESAYLKHMSEKHTQAVAVFESASMSGDPDVAAFARKGLSMLHEHQMLADNLRAAIGTRVANMH